MFVPPSCSEKPTDTATIRTKWVALHPRYLLLKRTCWGSLSDPTRHIFRRGCSLSRMDRDFSPMAVDEFPPAPATPSSPTSIIQLDCRH